MKHLGLAALAAGALLWVAPLARAQVSPFSGSAGGGFPGGGNQNASNRNNNNNRNGNNNGATLDLPPDVERLVAIDAYNTVIIQNAPNSFKQRYEAFRTQHIPARALARIFGGDVITTEQLMGLDLIGQGSFGNGGVGNSNFTGGIGGQNGSNGGFSNNNGNGFNNNTGLNNTTGFNNNNGFNNGGLGNFGGGFGR